MCPLNFYNESRGVMDHSLSRAGLSLSQEYSKGTPLGPNAFYQLVLSPNVWFGYIDCLHIILNAWYLELHDDSILAGGRSVVIRARALHLIEDSRKGNCVLACMPACMHACIHEIYVYYNIASIGTCCLFSA